MSGRDAHVPDNVKSIAPISQACVEVLTGPPIVEVVKCGTASRQVAFRVIKARKGETCKDLIESDHTSRDFVQNGYVHQLCAWCADTRPRDQRVVHEHTPTSGLLRTGRISLRAYPQRSQVSQWVELMAVGKHGRECVQQRFPSRR